MECPIHVPAPYSMQGTTSPSSLCPVIRLAVLLACAEPGIETQWRADPVPGLSDAC